MSENDILSRSEAAIKVLITLLQSLDLKSGAEAARQLLEDIRCAKK